MSEKEAQTWKQLGVLLDWQAAEIGRLRAAIKEHHETTHSSPYSHEASANKLYEVAFGGSVIGAKDD
jgi:hypothetical protein